MNKVGGLEHPGTVSIDRYNNDIGGFNGFIDHKHLSPARSMGRRMR
jgi:hypothetical protein